MNPGHLTTPGSVVIAAAARRHPALVQGWHRVLAGCGFGHAMAHVEPPLVLLVGRTSRTAARCDTAVI